MNAKEGEIDWNQKAKRLLKSELMKRGVNSDHLVTLLAKIGVKETKASIDSKISRGTFSAAFLIQCLNAVGCQYFLPEVDSSLVGESVVLYKTKNEP